MKYIKALLLLLAFLFQRSPVHANHLLGTMVTYEHLSAKKYQVNIVLYRECQGSDLPNSVDLLVRDHRKSKEVTLSASRVSIRNVGNNCKSSNPCSPLNTSGGAPGIEEHLYRVTVDLDETRYDTIIKSGDPIYFVVDQCCRNSGITNGASSTQLYNYAMLDLNYGHTSSAVSESTPIGAVCCNQPLKFNYKGQDPDGDSISYSIVNPLRSFGSTVTLRTPVLDCYYPGTLKYPYNNPNANPPIGFSIDPETGKMAFTPVGCSDLATVVVAITSWRKDTSGTYQKSSEIRREELIQVNLCPTQNTPQLVGITGPSQNGRFYACAGEEMKLDLVFEDHIKKPPPPNPLPDPDTISVKVLENTSGATYQIIPDTVPNKVTVRFKWKPDSGDISTKPYRLLLSASDNGCPFNLKREYTVEFNVVPKPAGSIKTTDLGCGNIQSTFQLDQPKFNAYQYHWAVMDSLGQAVDTSVVIFHSTWSDYGVLQTDQFSIKKRGKYIIEARASVNGTYCSTTYRDTIFVSDSVRGLFTEKAVRKCDKGLVLLKPTLYPASDFVSFEWSTGQTDSVLSYYFQSTTTRKERVSLKAVSKLGCTHFDILTLYHLTKPDIGFRKQVSSCAPLIDTIRVQASPEIDYINVLWDDTIKSYELPVQGSGTHYVSATNYCGTTIDSVVVTEWQEPQINLGVNRTVFCDADTVLLKSGLTNLVPAPTYVWNNIYHGSELRAFSLGKYTLKVFNSCGVSTDSITITGRFDTPVADLGPDLQVCDKTPIRLGVPSSKADVLWSTGAETDSIDVTPPNKLWIRISNLCGTATDTLETSILPAPVVDLGQDSFNLSQGLVMLDAGNPGSSYMWNTGDSSQRITVSKKGTYSVVVTNPCGSDSDTAYVGYLSNGTVNQTKFRLYPNPSAGKVYIEGEGISKYEVEVYSINGQKLDARSTRLGKEQVVLEIGGVNQVVLIKLMSEAETLTIPHVIHAD